LDCGESVQRQLRIMKISPTDIDYILITHWHGDHLLGLPGIFQSLSSMNYKKIKYNNPKRKYRKFEKNN